MSSLYYVPLLGSTKPWPVPTAASAPQKAVNHLRAAQSPSHLTPSPYTLLPQRPTGHASGLTIDTS